MKLLFYLCWLAVSLLFVVYPSPVSAQKVQPAQEEKNIPNVNLLSREELKFAGDLYGLCQSDSTLGWDKKERRLLGTVYGGETDRTFLSLLLAERGKQDNSTNKDTACDYVRKTAPFHCLQQCLSEIQTVKEIREWCEYFQRNESISQQLAFWYPEHFLLLDDLDRVAGAAVFHAWFSQLKPDNLLEQLAKLQAVSLHRFSGVRPSWDLILNYQPKMTGQQWANLKEAVRSRWNTDFGNDQAVRLKAWLYRYHYIEKWPGPHPSTDAVHDLRGFLFDEAFEIVGCKLENTDLWGARFHNTNLLKGEFTGTRIVDVDFKNSDLRESIFSGTKEKYGPHFSRFANCRLGKTVWKDAKINGVIINGSDLGGSRFINCDFTNTLFLSSNLRGVIFENCTFGENVKIINCQLADIDFKDTVLPDRFFAPSSFEKKQLGTQLSKFYDWPEPSFIARANHNRIDEDKKAIEMTLENALISETTLIQYRLLGMQEKEIYYVSQEEKALHEKDLLSFIEEKKKVCGKNGIPAGYPPDQETACDDKKACCVGYCGENSLLVELAVAGKNTGDSATILRREVGQVLSRINSNYLASGRKGEYRQGYVRYQINRKVDSLFAKLWHWFEGISSGYATKPGRFFLFFGIIVSSIALMKETCVILAPEDKTAQQGKMVANFLLLVVLFTILGGRIFTESPVATVFTAISVYATMVAGLWFILLGPVERLATFLFHIKKILNAPVQQLVALFSDILPGESNNTKILIPILKVYLVYEVVRIFRMWWI